MTTKYVIRWRFQDSEQQYQGNIEILPEMTGVMSGTFLTLEAARRSLWAEVRNTMKHIGSSKPELYHHVLQARCLCAEVGQEILVQGLVHWIKELTPEN